MTIDQIRIALDFLEENYSTATDAEAHGLAQALLDKIMSLRVQLAQIICQEDPYTTEADVRYFESQVG